MTPLLNFLLTSALSFGVGYAVLAETSFVATPQCAIGFAGSGNVISTVKARSHLDCARHCSSNPGCLAFNLCPAPGRDQCQLLPSWTGGNCSALQAQAGCLYREKKMDPCIHGTVDRARLRCVCDVGYRGVSCEHHLHDCAKSEWDGEALVAVGLLIQPPGVLQPFPVTCHFQWGLTTIFSRQLPCSDPHRLHLHSWQELKDGNGACSCDCFVGLENMRLLLLHRDFNMKVALQYNAQKSTAARLYSKVRLGTEAERYALTYRDSWPASTPAADNPISPGRTWKFCSPDHDCSGCAAGAGHAGWFDDSTGSGCPEVPGFDSELKWSIGGNMTDVNFIAFELSAP